MRSNYLILTILLFNVVSLRAQTADFTFSTSNNLFCAPQLVKFTASAAGNPSVYIWDFGDGKSGNLAGENHFYLVPGTYNVTLISVFSNYASRITKTVTINPSPTVSIAANIRQYCKTGNVTYTAAFTGPVTSFEWDFGDGTPIQTTPTNTVTHNYVALGTYILSVKAITGTACSATDQIGIRIDNFPLVASISPNKGCIPIASTITINPIFLPGDVLQSVVWNYGDGTPVQTTGNSSNTHTYNTTSPITGATVTVTSQQGCVSQYALPEFAFGIPPTNVKAYTVSLRDTFCASETVRFYGKADSANSYLWNFGEGTLITSDTFATKKYRSLGNKQVTLTPYYNGCEGVSRTFNIFIRGVVALYDYANTCNAKSRYSFNNQSLGNISQFEWTFSDVPGFIDSITYNPVHTFPSRATSNVRLYLYDSITKCVDTLSSTIYTAVPTFSADKLRVCKDSAITYTVSNSFPTGVGYNYNFFVNGTTVNNGDSANITLNPANFGTFNDFVVIFDQHPGTCSDTLRLPPITIRGPLVSLSFPRLICQDRAVVFVNNSYPWFSTDSIIKWSWKFGDGKTDSVRTPQPHLYGPSGTYILELEATDNNGCRQKLQSPIINAPLPTIKILPGIDTLCTGETVTLKGYTSDSLTWISNNTMCMRCDTVMVNPPVTTNYIALSTSFAGCKAYDTAVVKVFAPFRLLATPNQVTVCPGTPVQFNLNVAGFTTWSPPTYLNNPTSQSPIATPFNNVNYTILVRDSANCYFDTTTASVMVYSQPTVDAGPNKLLPYASTFTLNPSYSSGIQSYNWSPPDNLSCNTCPSPVMTALRSQQYFISVTDRNGCKSKDSVLLIVDCERGNILVPTAFTPNGDGLNDVLYPIARGYKTIRIFAVFNRSGEKVFERKNFSPNSASQGWNGYVKGLNRESIQAYVWMVEGECDTGATVVTKGSVILIR